MKEFLLLLGCCHAFNFFTENRIRRRKENPKARHSSPHELLRATIRARLDNPTSPYSPPAPPPPPPILSKDQE